MTDVVTKMNLFTAACLWEAALEALEVEPDKMAEPFRHQFNFEKSFQEHRARVGMAQLREEVANLAPACDADWDALPLDADERNECFDWEFAPRWLAQNFFASI